MTSEGLKGVELMVQVEFNIKFEVGREFKRVEGHFYYPSQRLSVASP